MKKIIKGMVLCIGIAVTLGGSCDVNAAAKARVSSVKAVSTKSGGIKVTFKKDKKAKSKKIKKYKIRVIKYSYDNKNSKWVKGKSSYKVISAYKGKKLKSTLSTKITKKPVTDSIMYKVSVASVNNKGKVVTAYSTSSNVGCQHDWYTYTKKVEATPAEYRKEEEMVCNACGFTGSDAEVDAHMTAYEAKLEECIGNEAYPGVIPKAYADKYKCTTTEFFYDFNTVCNWDSKVGMFILDWMSENTEFKGCNKDYTIGGCIYSTNTGNWIKTKIKDATYTTKVSTKCRKCGKDRD